MGKIQKQPLAPSPKISRAKAFKIEKKKKGNKIEIKLKAAALEVLEPKKLRHATETNGDGKVKKRVEANENEGVDIKMKQKKLQIPKNIINAATNKRPDKPQPNLAITRKIIKSAILGVMKLRNNNRKFKSQLIDDPYYLHLQIACHCVPKGHSKILRASLPHSPHPRDSEICIIVPDLKGIPIKEHEQHVEHYEELFRKKGVLEIKKIMTLHELKTEHETFEQKIRLTRLYDVFLCDARISGKVVKHCGKAFYTRHKVATPVKLQVTKLKEHLEKKVKTSMLHLHLKGNSYNIRFGNSEMGIEELIVNVESAVEFLDRSFPGGMDNISGIYVYTFRTTSIPIYLSGKSPNDVPTPKVPEKLPKAYKTHRGELTTFPNIDVIVKPTGAVRVVTINGDEEGSGRKRNTSTFTKKKNVTVVKEKKKSDVAAKDQGVSKKNKKVSAPIGEESVKRSKNLKKGTEEVSHEPKKKKVKKQVVENEEVRVNETKKVLEKKSKKIGKYVLAP